MLETGDTEATAIRVETCRLCILGAGIAGLNALFVATRYLNKTDRVVLIDRNDRCGGMWTETYDYVRLHQPHPMFTVGNIKWRLGKSREHLASREEVLDYFSDSLEVLRQRVNLVEIYGHELVSVAEAADGEEVKIRARSTATGTILEVDTERCIKAFGANVPRLDPLLITSSAVISTTPDRLFDPDGPASKATGPVYVVGGGKTGMDTAQALLDRFPTRPVSLLVGAGTVFAKRDDLFPSGGRRWWGGRMVLSVFDDIAGRYDGQNEDEVFDYFRKVYGVALEEGYKQFFFGILSQRENDALRAGLAEIIRDRFIDVTDGPEGPRLISKDGPPRQIPAGSVIVNCTGYVLRGVSPEELCLSTGGAVLTVTPSSAIHFLPSVGAYFLSHLFFLGSLSQTPLYVLNLEAAIRQDRLTFQMAGVTLSFHNLLVIMDSVPIKALLDCGLDFDLWYPLPRRIVALAKVQRGKARRIAHCRESLEKVRARLGIRCGPLAA